jgi:hypothetical protein
MGMQDALRTTFELCWNPCRRCAFDWLPTRPSSTGCVPLAAVQVAMAYSLPDMRNGAHAAVGYLLCAVQATVKLLYVLTRVFAHICKEGFCRPQEEQDAADGEGGATDFQDDVEGTGMGAGQGTMSLPTKLAVVLSLERKHVLVQSLLEFLLLLVRRDPVVARSGKKDVADQIEDEEQVLGLKGEKEEDPERGAEEEKDGGMEMQVPTRSRQQPVL